MKCISSPALEDIEIARYVDGEADEIVATHINQCPFCSERARQWTFLQNRLRKQFYRTTCPTPIELGDHHLGLLPASQALVVSQHVRECPLCQREVAELQEFLAEPDSPPGLFTAAKVLFAQLVGPGTASAVGALRGESKGPLTFEADGVVIVLDVQPTADERASILGQVAAEEQDQWTGANVELRQTDSSEMTSLLDDLGSFHFDRVQPGAAQITLKSTHGIIVHIMNIDISI
jgi:hypothetical protein